MYLSNMELGFEILCLTLGQKFSECKAGFELTVELGDLVNKTEYLCFSE